MGHGGARPGSGRPKGAKDKATKVQGATLAELAREHTDKAIKTYVRVMDDNQAPPAAQVAAASALLDRGYGKPPQFNTSDADEFKKAMTDAQLDERIRQLAAEIGISGPAGGKAAPGVH